MKTQDPFAYLKILKNLTEEQLLSQIESFATLMGEEEFAKATATNLVNMALPGRAVPKSLHHFEEMISDGIAFFLAHAGHESLRKAILRQYSLPLNCTPAERLLNLLEQFPSLHKLGQLVARNPGIDSWVKRFLTPLEQGRVTSKLPDVEQYITEQLATTQQVGKISFGGNILAEASVAIIVPFSWNEGRQEKSFDGIFKILKPGVASQLQKELKIMEDVLQFFETNRARYPLEQLELTGLFHEVKEDLRREIDLTAEQRNLKAAAKLYEHVSGVYIPRLLPFSTDTISAMERMQGTKVTELTLPEKQKRDLARLTFEAIICVPLFTLDETALFHGDPHAGNILAWQEKSSQKAQIALIDWTLAANLSRPLRQNIMNFMLGVLSDDIDAIAGAVARLQKANNIDLNKLVSDIYTELAPETFVCSDPLKKSFVILERLTMGGLIFPPELILFRKSFFTLEGVLHDLADDFSPGKAMEDYLYRLMLGELPARLGNSFFPVTASPANYPSMISTPAMNRIALYKAMSIWTKTLSLHTSFQQTHSLLTRDFMQFIMGNSKPA